MCNPQTALNKGKKPSLKILMVFSYFNRGDLLSKYIIMQMNSVQ